MASEEKNHESLALGRYRLEHRIASGSAGTVFAATDIHGDRRVIVKFIDNSEDGLGEWIKEARLALRLKHQNIARCFDVGYDQDHGLWALVYERALGGSLRKAMVADYPFSQREITELLKSLASALAFAHSFGVIHRDVKPENVLASEELGKPPWLLTDFGAGRFLESGSSAESVVGSLAYMAPEVMQRSADAMCDAFSLGMVAVELMIGRLPDRQSRSKFYLDYRYRGGLKGMVASLVAPFRERRPMNLQLVGELLEEGVADNFEVVGCDDRQSVLLNGDRVYQCQPGAESVRSFRVPRAQRIVSMTEAGDAVIASHRRIVVLTPEGPVTRFASEREFEVWAFVDKAAGVWVRRGDGLAYMTADQEVLKSADSIPEELLNAANGGGRLIGVSGSGGVTLLAVEGGATGLRCEVVGQTLRSSVLQFDSPVRELAVLDGRLLALAGNSKGALVFDCTEEMRRVGESADPVDAVRLTVANGVVQIASGITMRTDSLFLAPMSASAKAV